MNQAELNRQVAEATGEPLETIVQRGFVPLAPLPIEREPQFLYWEDVECQLVFQAAEDRWPEVQPVFEEIAASFSVQP